MIRVYASWKSLSSNARKHIEFICDGTSSLESSIKRADTLLTEQYPEADWSEGFTEYVINSVR